MFDRLKGYLKHLLHLADEVEAVAVPPTAGPKACACGNEKLYHKARVLCRKCYRRDRYHNDPVYRAKTLAYQAKYWERCTSPPALPEPSPPPLVPIVPADRNQEIADALRGGALFTEVAASFGMTKERVRQIARDVCPDVVDHRCSNPYCAARPKRFTEKTCAACKHRQPRPKKEKPLCACGKRAVFIKAKECRSCNKVRRYHSDPEYKARIKATAERCRKRNESLPPHRSFNPERAKRVVFLVKAGIAKDTIAAVEGVSIGTVEYYKRRYVDNVEQVQ
jgi:hypothetical protein